MCRICLASLKLKCEQHRSPSEGENEKDTSLNWENGQLERRREKLSNFRFYFYLHRAEE